MKSRRKFKIGDRVRYPGNVNVGYVVRCGPLMFDVCWDDDKHVTKHGFGSTLIILPNGLDRVLDEI